MGMHCGRQHLHQHSPSVQQRCVFPTFASAAQLTHTYSRMRVMHRCISSLHHTFDDSLFSSLCTHAAVERCR